MPQDLFVDIDIDIAEVEKSLNNMGITCKEARRSFKRAYSKAVNRVKRAVVAGAKTVTSNREKSSKGLTSSVWKGGNGGAIRIWRGNYLPSTGKYFALVWLDRGTSDVIGRDGRRHGATPPHPFFEAAVRSSAPGAVADLERDILAELEKAYNRR